MQSCLGLLIVSSVSVFSLASEYPNVVYILADDLGIGDLGCYGQQKLKTPNIDRLATEGIRFTNHYSGNTVCSPSRAVLMTGQHPGQVSIRGNNGEKLLLDPEMKTLAEVFKDAGYATGAYGKWGLGETNLAGAANPLSHGFDHFSGWTSQVMAHTYYPPTIVRDGQEEPLKAGTYVHDLIMEDAFAFVKANAEAEQPFFCYIPTAIPHAAMQAPKELHEKWRKAYPEFEDKFGSYKAGKFAIEPVQNPIAGFAAMMENLDNQVGELLDMLVELGIDDNTIVLFSSDNGAHHEGGHDPEFWNSNGPLRGHKRDLYEGGIRTPFLVRWPGQVAAGRVEGHMSAFWDALPTMAELIGQPVPEQSDGISLLPSLLGQEGLQEEHEYLYFEFLVGASKPYAKRALRQGDWKVVQRAKSRGSSEFLPIELYDLNEDAGEDNDLASQNPELVQRLEQLMDQARNPLN